MGRFEIWKLFKLHDYLPASLVAEKADGAIVGFVIGERCRAEYDIFQEEASSDTLFLLRCFI